MMMKAGKAGAIWCRRVPGLNPAVGDADDADDAARETSNEPVKVERCVNNKGCELVADSC